MESRNISWKTLILGLLMIILVFVGIFIHEKKAIDKFFAKKHDIRIGMKVSELLSHVGKPSFELLIDSTSINVANFPKELISNKKKYYVFIYTVPSIKRWIRKFNNLDFSYDVYVDEKKETVVYF